MTSDKLAQLSYIYRPVSAGIGVCFSHNNEKERAFFLT